MAKAAGKGGDARSRRQQSGREKAVQQPQNVSQQTTLLTCCEGRDPRCQAPSQKARGTNALSSAPEGRKKQSSASACKDSTACKPLMTVDTQTHTHTHTCVKSFSMCPGLRHPDQQLRADPPLGEEQLRCLSLAGGRVVRATRKIEAKPLKP